MIFPKKNIKELAVFGGEKLFSIPRSTSNLLQPDIDKFLYYSKIFFDQGQYTNNGPLVKLLEKRLATFHDTKYCVTFSSGFWALVLAIRTLALEGKSEIIMPSLTYRRMADIASWVGLKPHFCEVDPSTLAMTTETVSACINSNTALILGVHPIVNCADSDKLTELAEKHGIPILFDSVESVYETTAAGKVGSHASAECFSLHACKLFNGFGGGYLTTNNTELANRLASLRSFGFTDVDTVTFQEGMNAKLNEIHAAMTLASLDDIEDQIALNRERYYTYKTNLKIVNGLRLLEFDESFRAGFKNIVAEITEDWPLSRKDTIMILNADNVLARPYYSPALHQKEMNYAHVKAHLPVTDELSQRFINFPCGQLVSNEDIIKIVDMLKFLASNAACITKELGALNENE